MSAADRGTRAARATQDAQTLGVDVAVNLHHVATRDYRENLPPDFELEPAATSGRDDDDSTTVVAVRAADGQRFALRIVVLPEVLPDLDEERRQVQVWRDEQLDRARRVREHPVIRRNGLDVTASFRCRWVPDGGDWPDGGWSGTVHGSCWRGGWICDALERVSVDRVNGRVTRDGDKPATIIFEPYRDLRAPLDRLPHRLVVPVPAVRPAPWSGYAAPDVDAVPDPEPSNVTG